MDKIINLLRFFKKKKLWRKNNSYGEETKRINICAILAKRVKEKTKDNNN